MDNIPVRPKYIDLYESGELSRRTESLLARLSRCDICPRKCAVDRLDGQAGFCRSGRQAIVASVCDHHGEEPAISGSKGSGTIFFGNCNLRCAFCQNHQISQSSGPWADAYTDSLGLAGRMLHLQNDLHCHNINLVSPSHFVPQIVEAVLKAVPLGLHLPLVYNTNTYDSIDTLRELHGIVDIYLPDIKYASDKWAQEFSQAPDYVRYSRLAIQEMYRQVGNLVMDSDGVARKGLIVRHLILPNNIAGTSDSLGWLAREVSPTVTLSIMAQYYPCHRAPYLPALSRKITEAEYRLAVGLLDEVGLEHGWLQELDSAESYLPDFKQDGHPFYNNSEMSAFPGLQP